MGAVWLWDGSSARAVCVVLTSSCADLQTPPPRTNHTHTPNTEPGSVNWKINQRIRRGAQLQGKQMLRIAGALEEVEAELEAEQQQAQAAAAAGGPQPGALLAEALPGDEQAAAAAAAAAAGSSSSSGGFAWPWQQRQDAAAAVTNSSSSSRAAPFASLGMASSGGGLWMAGPLSSASLSLGVGRASKAVLGTMARAARRAPCLAVNSGRGRPVEGTGAAAGAAGSSSSSRR
jgi:hypothetical protein